MHVHVRAQIAQVLSTRVDMFPEAYLEEFRRLQDNVPTFSTVEARVVLEDGAPRGPEEHACKVG